LIRNEYANGYGPAAIAAKIKQELGIDRATGAVTSKIQQQPDYKTVLLNLHLENLQKLSGTSHQEIEFFTELGKYNSLPRCERNVRIPGTRYNADGLDPASKTIVEYFGTLWHADPKKYHNEDQWLGRLSCTVGDIHAKDAIKLKRLQGLGYTVVVVWEREWTKRDTRQQCLDRVRAALV
jgi:hypothetical protein